MNLFECKVRFEKIVENGQAKKVTESYLVESMSHAEAEARIIEEMKPTINGEFDVVGVRPFKCSELMVGEEGGFYKAKVAFAVLNEQSGSEKLITVTMLMMDSSFERALVLLRETMKTSMVDYEIISISKTKIIDLYTHGVY